MSHTQTFFHESVRKVFHMIAGILIVITYTAILYLFSERIAMLSLVFLLLVLLEIEYIRLDHRPKMFKPFDVLFRKHEQDSMAGSVFFVISGIICFAVFDYWIALIAMCMTIFGDLIAAIVGKSLGKTKIHKNKSVVGTFAGFAANVIVGVIILPSYFYIVLAMASVATIIELFTDKLDDNLTVPVASGFIGQVLVYYLGINLQFIMNF